MNNSNELRIFKAKNLEEESISKTLRKVSVMQNNALNEKEKSRYLLSIEPMGLDIFFVFSLSNQCFIEVEHIRTAEIDKEVEEFIKIIISTFNDDATILEINTNPNNKKETQLSNWYLCFFSLSFYCFVFILTSPHRISL